MKCPVCALELIVVERNSIELDYCIHCQGLWFDAGEIELLAKTLQLKTALPDFSRLEKTTVLEKPRRCPRCSNPMDKIRVGQQEAIVLDRCPNGEGLWFSKGELGKVCEQYRVGAASGMIEFLGEVFSG